MRLRVVYSLHSDRLPVEYRRGFASLLKEAIKRSDPLCFQRYYSRLHVLKPFTFSLFFPGLIPVGDGDFRVGTKAILHISSNSRELISCLYNGLRSLPQFPLFHNTATLQSIFLTPFRAMTISHARFKTMAPVLVNTKGDPNHYLLPDDKGFEEGLRFSVREIARTFLNMPDAPIDFRPLDIHRKVIRHYNMHMQGFVGVFELQGQPEVLNLIYQVGLGVRRSQGFGMLELVPTPSREKLYKGEGDIHE
ncbi:MAG: CRISPR-associated endoribonuclease Cas6 [Thermogutta sp.]|nr:MAG: CRISPR-associated endoribonuclease Cas6 [Thermogutta sp.]